MLPRTFYSYETSGLYSDCDVENCNSSSPLRQRASSLHQDQVTKTEKREGDGTGVPVTSKKSKSKPNKSSIPRETKGIGIRLCPLESSPKLKKHCWKHDSTYNVEENLFIFCSGIKGNLKSVPMITISELDNWEISSSSGMKYGQFVDWEKIHPEAAARYQQILKSEQKQLKTMAREGFWAMPHTLRAKAYYHIIHGINSRLRPLPYQVATF